MKQKRDIPVEKISVKTSEIPIQEEIVNAVMKKRNLVATTTGTGGTHVRNHTPSRLSWCTRMAYYWIMGFELEEVDNEIIETWKQTIITRTLVECPKSMQSTREYQAWVSLLDPENSEEEE